MFLTNAPGGYVLYSEPKQVYVINVTEKRVVLRNESMVKGSKIMARCVTQLTERFPNIHEALSLVPVLTSFTST